MSTFTATSRSTTFVKVKVDVHGNAHHVPTWEPSSGVDLDLDPKR